MRLMIFGDSHAVALGRGLMSLKEKGGSFSGVAVAKLFGAPQVSRAFHTAEGDRITINGAAGVEFANLTGKDNLGAEDRGTVYGCSIGFTTTKFYRTDMWAKYTTVPGISSKQFVSEGVTAAMFRHYNRHALEFYAQARRIGLDIFAIAAPPPQPGDPAYEDGISPPEFLKIDQVCRRVFEADLAAIDVPICASPASAYTPEGWLKPQFSHERVGDFHHGNLAYGELMLTEVVSFATARYGHDSGSPHKVAMT